MSCKSEKSHDCRKYGLLPCPMCGSENLYLYSDASSPDEIMSFEIQCADCGIRSAQDEVPYNNEAGEYYEDGEEPFDKALEEFVRDHWNERKLLSARSISDKLKGFARRILKLIQPRLNIVDCGIEPNSLSELEWLMDAMERHDAYAEACGKKPGGGDAAG